LILATRNDVTGQEIKSRPLNDAYSANWDAIFGKKNKPVEEVVDEVVEIDSPTDVNEN